MYATSSGRALKGYPTPLRVNKACEENLLAVFASLRRCIECGPLTRAEVYLGNIRGRLIFFPGLPMRWSICGGWSLDLCSLEVRHTFAHNSDSEALCIGEIQQKLCVRICSRCSAIYAIERGGIYFLILKFEIFVCFET